MNHLLIANIERALETVRYYAQQGFWPAPSLVQQLEWCQRRVCGEMLEPPLFPLCMASLLHQQHADRGEYSLLIHELREIEQSMEELEMRSFEYTALCA